MELRFDYVDLACLGIAVVLGAWYLYEKHWVANNIFGLAFSVNGIEMLSLDTYMVGCYLLGGLFVYDIFWVFATDVMVTVAKSFEAPIKLLFPKDLLINGWYSSQFTMLGLGDIVIPGMPTPGLLCVTLLSPFLTRKAHSCPRHLYCPDAPL